jgi:hypothetical protein
MTSESSEDDFKVGLGSDVKRTLEVPVRLNEQGKARRVSTQEAALLRG